MNRKGFSLVELLGCLAIMGMILCIGLYSAKGTLATSVIAAINHCMFVRVHDVKENYRAVKMTEAIYG